MIFLSPVLQPVQISLNGNTIIWYTLYSFQFCVICKIVELIVQVINDEVKHPGSISTLGQIISDLPLIGLCAADYNPLGSRRSVSFQAILVLLILPVLCQLVYEDAMGYYIKCLTQGKQYPLLSPHPSN